MKNETIVDRVVDRIKKQPLGDLITEEDLFDIVKEAIPKAFFQKRVEKKGYDTVEKEPAIVEILREVLKESASIAVKEYLIENTDMMASYWKEVMDKNLLKYVQAIQDEQATLQVKKSLSSLVQSLNEERAKLNMPYINGFY